jgi:hypothetical protein
MAKFEKQDKVSWVQSGKKQVGFVTGLPEGNEGLYEVMNTYTSQYTYLPEDKISNEYDYEREAGHTDLPPKGINPPTA